jgi:Zn-dependent protease
MDLAKIIIVLGVLVMSCVLHEVMHAWSAWRMGDPTAKNLGRITLNPLPHIDPFMSILLPALLLLSTGGKFCFGGARPVPINPANFRHPGRGMMISAAAGPLTNLALALAGGTLLILLSRLFPGLIYGQDEGTWRLTYNGYVLCQVVMLNVLLGVFNLMPLPSLDGSRVLRYFLPPGGQRLLDQAETFGLLIVMLFVYFGGSIVLLPALLIVLLALGMGMGPEGFEALRAEL